MPTSSPPPHNDKQKCFSVSLSWLTDLLSKVEQSHRSVQVLSDEWFYYITMYYGILAHERTERGTGSEKENRKIVDVNQGQKG